MLGRALLAIGLMVGFYVFALGIVAGLVWVPYAEWIYLGRIHLKIALACLGGAGAIVWAVIPRADRFEPPGPELTSTYEPRLFALIQEVASTTGQDAPREVYLVGDVNAWVAQRGGVMGFGSRRVMGVGLPLLQALSVAEFRAVLAHEFGHYWGGDVALGPWIYKTRAAIGRAIAQLEGNLLQSLFNLYGQLFMKLTMAVSRRQEYVADQVAARVAGADVMQVALKRVNAAAPAHDAYMRTEVAPVLNSGFLPPVIDGFASFRAVPAIAASMDRVVDEAIAGGVTGEFDTHPALRERLAALDGGPKSTAPDDGTPAISLMRDPDGLNRALLVFSAGEENVDRLKPVSWDRVAETVYLPHWRSVVESHRAWLASVQVQNLPSGKASFGPLVARLISRGQLVDEEARLNEGIQVIGMAIGCLLAEGGWTVKSDFAQPVVLVNGHDVFNSIQQVRQLAMGQTTSDDWRARCESLGIAGHPLATRSTSPTR